MEGIFIQEDGEKRVIVLLEFVWVRPNKVRVKRDLVFQAA